MLEQVISGGQTGADMAGLIAAQAAGLRTGGWMPKGWKTENGPRPDLAKQYGLQESVTSDYRERTRLNVICADATFIIAEHMDQGSGLTNTICERHGKPRLLVPVMTELMTGVAMHWLLAQRVRVLNIAGNRESRSPGLQVEAAGWLEQVFRAVKRGEEGRSLI